MNHQLLLNEQFQCKCGNNHYIPIEDFFYGENIQDRIAELLQKKNIFKATIVSDQRTFGIFANKLGNYLEQNNYSIKNVIIDDKDGKQPQCDDITYEWLKQQINQSQTEIVIAVGSGTINDLCKWASYELQLPYVVAATAASMNGYASANVGSKINKVKVVVRANSPIAVFAESEIIENAPIEMTTAGFADTLAKFQSTADWSINNLLFDEYYCPYCADILQGLQDKYLQQPEKIKNSDKEAIKALFEALFLTGAVMTMIGTSTPASGGEHLLSHTLDMTAGINEQKHWLHGLQVGLGTIISAVLYQKIIEIDKPELFDIPKEITTSYWQESLLIKSVRAQYQEKQKYFQKTKKKIANPKIFQEVRDRVITKTIKADEIKTWLKKSGAPQSYQSLGCSRERLRGAILHMHEMRSRFTVIDLAWMLGVLPKATDEIIDNWLTE